MSLDPIDYDVVELREIARRRGDRYVEDGFLWPEPSEGFPPIDELADVSHETTWTGSFEERQKPYLDSLPETDAADELARAWVGRLVDAAGFEGTVEALAYYEALGWITESVEASLHDYLLAAGNTPGGTIDDLDREAHVDSLARVVALVQLLATDGDAGGHEDGTGGESANADGEPGGTVVDEDGGDVTATSTDEWTGGFRPLDG